MASIKRKGRVVRVQLRPEERAILSGLAREVAQLLGGSPSADRDPLEAMVGMADAAVEQPDDPAVLRLLPDAYDDPSGAAEFRRLTDAELRRGKTTALMSLAETVAATEGTLELTPQQTDEWLAAVNDIRLVLGVRLDISDDSGHWRASLPPDDPRHPLIAAYDWLSMVQELLIDALPV